MSEQNPIFERPSGGLSEEQLLLYLEGRLSPEAAREVEALLAEEGMESDAVEGLQGMDSAEVKRMSTQLNLELHRQLRSGKRVRRRGMDNKWSWIAVLVILLAAVLAYAVIYLAKRS